MGKIFNRNPSVFHEKYAKKRRELSQSNKASIILDGEGLDSSTSNIRTRMLTAQILLTTVLDILVRAVRQKKTNTGIQTGKEGRHESLYLSTVLSCVQKRPLRPTRKGPNNLCVCVCVWTHNMLLNRKASVVFLYAHQQWKYENEIKK